MTSAWPLSFIKAWLCAEMYVEPAQTVQSCHMLRQSDIEIILIDHLMQTDHFCCIAFMKGMMLTITRGLLTAKLTPVEPWQPLVGLMSCVFLLLSLSTVTVRQG